MTTKRPTFQDRGNYRQRRIRDGSQLVPVLGIILLVLPLFWPQGSADDSLTSAGLVYLFSVWFVLIGLAFLLSRMLRFIEGDRPHASDGASQEQKAQDL